MIKIYNAIIKVLTENYCNLERGEEDNEIDRFNKILFIGQVSANRSFCATRERVNKLEENKIIKRKYDGRFCWRKFIQKVS